MPNITMLDRLASDTKTPENNIKYVYSAASPITALAPVQEAPTGVFGWSVANNLALINSSDIYREIGSEPTTLKAKPTPFQQNIRVLSTRCKTDRVVSKISPNTIKYNKRIALQTTARQWTKDFFEGDGASGKGVIGIDKFIDDNVEYNGQQVAGGSAILTESMMDEMVQKMAIEAGFPVIFCSSTVFRRMKTLARGNAVAGYNIPHKLDEFGYWKGIYDNIRVIPLVDGKGVDLLATADTKSNVYGVVFGDDMLTLFQAEDMMVTELTDSTDTVFSSFDLEWLMNYAPQAPRSIVKINDVKNSLT